MIYSDLHCDTLTRCFEKGESFFDARGHINYFKIEQLQSTGSVLLFLLMTVKEEAPPFLILKCLLIFMKRSLKK